MTRGPTGNMAAGGGAVDSGSGDNGYKGPGLSAAPEWRGQRVKGHEEEQGIERVEGWARVASAVTLRGEGRRFHS